MEGDRRSDPCGRGLLTLREEIGAAQKAATVVYEYDCRVERYRERDLQCIKKYK